MELQQVMSESTVVAIATPPGTGGIAVIRVSGPHALEIVDSVWKGRKLSGVDSHTAHFGRIVSEDGSVLDDVVATVFRAPHSFTGEDTVEISCHGSEWIQREIVNELVAYGAEPAGRGEFTRRAFMNGRMDLAQAEGVADLIAASSRAAHSMAVSQVSGTFSRRLSELRDKLIDLGSLLELELDFSEEDVEFADRTKLLALTEETEEVINKLVASYRVGASMKNGVPVVIAGVPNSGKSTLLNALLHDDRAIVSDVPGTTRDIIEGTAEIGGVLFRFFDTAGLRETTDTVEQMGIDRAVDRIAKSRLLLCVVNPLEDIGEQVLKMQEYVDLALNRNDSELDRKIIYLVNKTDQLSGKEISKLLMEMLVMTHTGDKILFISAKTGDGIDRVEKTMVELVSSGFNPDEDLIVTNERHHASLVSASESLARVHTALTQGISADFIAQDLRATTATLSEITGQVTTDTLLQTIFSRFCIGK